MHLIKHDETEDRVMIDRETDTARSKFETYTFDKKDNKWELVNFKSDEGFLHYPPEIPEPVKNRIEERFNIDIEIAPIYPLRCSDCNAPSSARVKVEDTDYGEKPVNDTKEARCPMCFETKEMEIVSHGAQIQR